ncbi:MAG: TlyA family methyltransferase [Vampirovibrio sp.]|jgi:23S rRNA (cytidine1920-2'-O)/16S rRNA (cytidine1409-2'-O)-methyltransferase|nr:TlyA family methyltransferase [Vampirovibrio sp.]
MPPTPKERLDKLLVDRGLCASRAQAQALIMDGKVKVSGQPVTKPGTQVALDESDIDVAGLQPYVSRGGLKLEKALAAFHISPSDRACMDVGASTGGFTDCLLQNGAASVVSVDVGYGQLDWKLRNDARVQVLEKTNIRELQPESLQSQPSLGVVDTSFISLKKVLPPLAALLTPDAEMMALLKPQFEHRDYLTDSSFKGVVRGIENHQKILQGVLTDLETLLPDWHLIGLDFSPITGPKGNIEFLLHYARGHYATGKSEFNDLNAAIQAVIEKSYESHPFA